MVSHNFFSKSISAKWYFPKRSRVTGPWEQKDVISQKAEKKCIILFHVRLKIHDVVIFKR
jgi:hypothetical protein